MSSKQKEINDLKEEIEVILSIKDELSNEEINNFVDSFPSLTEKEIRENIAEITNDNEYLEGFHKETEIVEEISENINTEELNIKKQFDEKQVNIENKTFEKSEITEIVTINESSERKKEKTEEIIINKIEESKGNNESQIETIEDLNSMLIDVVAIVGEVKHNQLCLQWQWPEKVNKIKVVYRGDSFAKSAEDSSSIISVIKREKDESTGEFIIDRISEGNYYFTIYAMAEMNGKAFYSEGKRRLMVNKKPIEIYYDLKIKRSLLGKLKSAEIMFSMEEEEEIKLPAITVIGKRGNMPIQKSDGDSMCNFNEVVLTKNKPAVFEFPVDSIQSNMYIKLFVINDKEGSRYRIISPAREKLYFK